MKRCQFLIIAIIFCGTLPTVGVSQYNLGADGRNEYARGQAYLKINYFDAAMQSFRKAVEINPDYIAAIKALAGTARTVKQRMDPKLRLSFTTMLTMRKFYAAKAAADPKNAVYQWALGQFDESPTEEEAERCYRNAISLDAGFLEAYQSLASTLLYRGKVADARVMLRKVYELSSTDPEAMAAYTLHVNEEDPSLYVRLTEEFLRQFRENAAGADLIARMAANESDLATRITTLERLKALYPPNESEVTEWYMRFLFDAYLRTNPPNALSLAQEMTRLMPVRSFAKMDWQYFSEYAQSLVLARSLLDQNSYAEVSNSLAEAKPPYLVSPDPQTILRAEAAAKSGKANRPYEILVSAMAEQPSETLKPILMRYSVKPPAQVEEDIWSARLKKAPTVKDFVLPALREGKNVRLNEYRGRVVLLNFWYPGDRASREEFLYLQKMLDRYGPQGFTIITINIKPEENAIAAVLMDRYNFVALCAPDDKWAGKNYQIDRLPASILIDRQGRAVFRPEFWGSDPRHTCELEVEAMLAYASKGRQ